MCSGQSNATELISSTPKLLTGKSRTLGWPLCNSRRFPLAVHSYLVSTSLNCNSPRDGLRQLVARPAARLHVTPRHERTIHDQQEIPASAVFTRNIRLLGESANITSSAVVCTADIPDFLGLAIGDGPARYAEMDLIPNCVRDITATSDSTWH
jgi:hypothetical protein